jgi:flagellar motor switch protein FliN/FliY
MPGSNSLQPARNQSEAEIARRIAGLPAYTRSLLRIKVPVQVTLATTRQAMNRVLDLGPGSILHFGKAYDDPLTLAVGRCEVAVGEAVKVGDKFGLKITSMVMPEEKFLPLTPPEPRS